MDAERQPVDPDLVSVRRGSRLSHRMAWLIFGFGIFTYVFLVLVVLIVTALPGQELLSQGVTLPVDTTLGLLGVSATVLIALVATLWAAGQVAEADMARGRRRALTAVTTATGIGSVVIGVAGAAHRPDEGLNLSLAAALLCLGLVLAYASADVAFVIEQDRVLDRALRRLDAEDRLSNLQTAQSNWLRRSRDAGWKQARRQRWNRLGQTVLAAGVIALVLVAALAMLSGRPAVASYLGRSCLEAVASLVIGQLAAHGVAVTFATRRWDLLYLCSLLAVLYLLVGLVAQASLVESMNADAIGSEAGNGVYGMACWLLPPLSCLFGLTVSPRHWRRLRPMTQIRWSVIDAIERQIDRVRAGLARPEPDQQNLRGFWLVRAVRRATGTEAIEPGGV
ncbi:hypothetical protein [Jatrophihabitans sp.]|uniref:hypothetical protein n=1 Tax=Jatrophihabitans sp. TaxID=1932789 RepID=UPI002C67F6AF|nr:hypothetical protein [Jatrophihabitans sp.]